MPASVGVNEVDSRVASVSGDFVTARLARVLPVDIAEPLRVDNIDGVLGVLEFIDPTKVGHLAEVEERFRGCVQFLGHDSVAIKSVPKISKVFWVSLETFVVAVFGEYSYLAPVHGWRVFSDLPELFERPCGVDVDDEELAGTSARPKGGDDAVDVLRGRKQERYVLLLSNCLEDCFFDCRLVGKKVVIAMQHGAFEEEDIDVANRALHEILEEYSLSAM